MKVLLYTISDLKIDSIRCVDLLLSSIVYDIEYDFYIISNKPSSNRIAYNLIIDDVLPSNYIGYLKYSEKLPDNYDYYIYLDSDILYFDKLSKLIDGTKEFSVVAENYEVGNGEWFYFKYSNLDEQNTINFKKSKALNAGSFAFKRSSKNTMHLARSLYNTYHNNDIDHDVKLEQCIFNYIIHSNTNYILDNCFNITNTVELFASNKPPKENKKLYHFCGFTNEMGSKYRSMKEFYDKYKK
jgi:hypothetical protein